MKTLQAEIEARIDVMVQEIMGLVRGVAVNAVTQALGVTAVGTAMPVTRPRQEARRLARPARNNAEIAQLVDRLYAAVCRSPGETMAFYAGQLGSSSALLAVPALKLCQRGLARKVGKRNHTRYFPMAEHRPH